MLLSMLCLLSVCLDTLPVNSPGLDSSVSTYNLCCHAALPQTSTSFSPPFLSQQNTPQGYMYTKSAWPPATSTSRLLFSTTLMTVTLLHHRSSSCCDSGSDSDSSYSSNSSQKGSWANLEGRRWTHPEKPHHPHHRHRLPPGLGQVVEETEGFFFDVQLQVRILKSMTNKAANQLGTGCSHVLDT